MKIILFHLEIFEVRRPKYKKEKALIRQGFPKMRSPFFDKNVRKTDFVQMVDAKGIEPSNLTDANRALSQGGKFSAHGLRCMV